MALQILNAPGREPEEIASKLEEAIRTALPGAEIEVHPGGPGHYSLRVVSSAFEGQSRVKQQQLVYGAIAPLMAGNDAPVHAVDKLTCETP